MLITAIERQQAELAKDLEERQLEAERKAEELLEELEKEIHELQTRSSELQHLELTRSSLHLLQVRFICCILPYLKAGAHKKLPSAFRVSRLWAGSRPPEIGQRWQCTLITPWGWSGEPFLCWGTCARKLQTNSQQSVSNPTATWTTNHCKNKYII